MFAVLPFVASFACACVLFVCDSCERGCFCRSFCIVIRCAVCNTCRIWTRTTRTRRWQYSTAKVAQSTAHCSKNRFAKTRAHTRPVAVLICCCLIVCLFDCLWVFVCLFRCSLCFVVCRFMTYSSPPWRNSHSINCSRRRRCRTPSRTCTRRAVNRRRPLPHSTR